MKKINPLKLKKSELKTLALIQELARRDESSWAQSNIEGDQRVNITPTPVEDRLYFGNFSIPKPTTARLFKRGVWLELERKGLAKPITDHSVTITREGLNYPTGGMMAEVPA